MAVAGWGHGPSAGGGATIVKTKAASIVVGGALALAGCVVPLTTDFDDGVIDECWAQQEAAPDRLSVVDNPDGAGKVLQVEVHAGDVAIPADTGTGKSRAELRMVRDCSDRYPHGVPVYYAWSVYLPPDYPYDGSSAFQIIGQFHHRDIGGPPAVAVHLALAGRQPVFRFTHRSDQTDPPTVLADVPFELGRWYRIGFRAVWSQDPTVGRLEIRVDGTDVLPEPLVAANAFDPNPKTMKVGLYRGPGVTTDNVLYVDDIRVGNSWEAVGATP